MAPGSGLRERHHFSATVPPGRWGRPRIEVKVSIPPQGRPLVVLRDAVCIGAAADMVPRSLPGRYRA